MSQPTGIFDFATLADVLAIQARAYALLAEGKTIMSTSGEGKSSGKQFTMPIDQLLNEVNYRLRQLGFGGETVVRQVRKDFSGRRYCA